MTLNQLSRVSDRTRSDGGFATNLLVDSKVDIGDTLLQDGRQSNRHGSVGERVFLHVERDGGQCLVNSQLGRSESRNSRDILGKLWEMTVRNRWIGDRRSRVMRKGNSGRNVERKRAGIAKRKSGGYTSVSIFVRRGRHPDRDDDHDEEERRVSLPGH